MMDSLDSLTTVLWNGLGLLVNKSYMAVFMFGDHLTPNVLSYYSDSGGVPFNIFLHLLMQKYLYPTNISDTIILRHDNIDIIQG